MADYQLDRLIVFARDAFEEFGFEKMVQMVRSEIGEQLEAQTKALSQFNAELREMAPALAIAQLMGVSGDEPITKGLDKALEVLRGRQQVPVHLINLTSRWRSLPNATGEQCANDLAVVIELLFT